MSYASRRAKHRVFDIWPGYVDALSSMLMMIALVLMVMVAAQFYLSNAINTKDIAIDELSLKLQALADSLAFEQTTSKTLKARNIELEDTYQKTIAEVGGLRSTLSEKEKALALEQSAALAIKARNVELEDSYKKTSAELGTLRTTLSEKEKALAHEQNTTAGLKVRNADLEQTSQKTKTEVTGLRASLSEREKVLALEQSSAKTLKARNADLEKINQKTTAELAALRAAIADKEKTLALITRDKGTTDTELSRSKNNARTLTGQLESLAGQIEALNKKLALLTADLTSAKTTLADKDKKITDLDQRLKLALAQKVEELADYRSEFFGKLKKALSNRPEIRVVGDRFVFQSEVLFPSGSADLEEGGKQELVKIADTLQQMSRSIPKEVNWILTVVGHTDKRPINTPLFRSNWELSSARAISVVKFLAEAGIPPERLAATGYGEYQPIDDGTSDEALAKNRRIELKFNQK
jgi:chemotaxis protein MotB